jgi:hypothetical protein
MFILRVFWVFNHDVFSTHGYYFSFRKINDEEYTNALLAQKLCSLSCRRNATAISVIKL